MMEFVELDAITTQQWSELVAGEREPWGGEAEHLVWGDKQRYVGLRGASGRLVAVAGAVTTAVDVAGAERFQVVGIGSVLVTASERGRGLVWDLLQRLLEIAADMGPERAMLFCRPQMTGLYGKLGFAGIPGPTWVQQPDGDVEMPLRTMWRPLREGVGWPDGRVDVLRLPF
jgi:predicted GNAT family N-acyltransferase